MPQRYLERARAFVAARAVASSARPETGPARGEVAAPDSRRQEAPRSAAGGVSLAARGPTGAPCRTCGSARWWRPLADRPDYWVCAICHPLPDASLPLAQPVALGAQVLAAALAAHKAALLALLATYRDPWPALLQRFRATWLAVGRQYDVAPPAERQRLAAAFALGQAFEHAWQRQDLALAQATIPALEQLLPGPAPPYIHHLTEHRRSRTPTARIGP